MRPCDTEAAGSASPGSSTTRSIGAGAMWKSARGRSRTAVGSRSATVVALGNGGGGTGASGSSARTTGAACAAEGEMRGQFQASPVRHCPGPADPGAASLIVPGPPAKADGGPSGRSIGAGLPWPPRRPNPMPPASFLHKPSQHRRTPTWESVYSLLSSQIRHDPLICSVSAWASPSISEVPGVRRTTPRPVAGASAPARRPRSDLLHQGQDQRRRPAIAQLVGRLLEPALEDLVARDGGPK